MTAELPPSGNTTHTRPENRAFFPALDGLRALAFLMVFGQHYLALAWGWTGVNIFFVLSGFLITGILFDSRDDLHRFRNFYVRRSLRIFPLYYGLFAALVLLWPVMHWRWDRWWLAWPLYLGNYLLPLIPGAVLPGTLQQAAVAHLTSRALPRTELYLGHLWSLCVEEQFYLVWPAIVFFVRDRRKLLWICTGSVLLGPFLRWWLQTHAPQAAITGFTPAQADALLLGGLVALLWRGPAQQTLLATARVVAGLCTATFAAYMLFGVGSWQMNDFVYPRWSYTGGILFADLYAAALIVCALQPGGWIYRAFRIRPLRWIGRLSYGAYVFHDVLHGLFVHIVVHSNSGFLPGDRLRLESALLALTTTLLLTWLSFRFYESPFLNLKDRWTLPGTAPEPAHQRQHATAL